MRVEIQFCRYLRLIQSQLSKLTLIFIHSTGYRSPGRFNFSSCKQFFLDYLNLEQNMMKVEFDSRNTIQVQETITGLEIENQLLLLWGLLPSDYYLIHNGKIFRKNTSIDNGIVHIIPRVFGGKGGFGSLLKAMGAKIQQNSNREACRDLNGRRLRDIHEEERLKVWFETQAERAREAKETKDRKKAKLERLCEKPRHDFNDEEYDKERSKLPDVIEDAVLQGLHQAMSNSKRKRIEETSASKKKLKLWMDDEDTYDEDIDTDEDSSDETPIKKENAERDTDSSKDRTILREERR